MCKLTRNRLQYSFQDFSYMIFFSRFFVYELEHVRSHCVLSICCLHERPGRPPLPGLGGLIFVFFLKLTPPPLCKKMLDIAKDLKLFKTDRRKEAAAVEQNFG